MSLSGILRSIVTLVLPREEFRVLDTLLILGLDGVLEMGEVLGFGKTLR